MIALEVFGSARAPTASIWIITIVILNDFKNLEYILTYVFFLLLLMLDFLITLLSQHDQRIVSGKYKN